MTGRRPPLDFSDISHPRTWYCREQVYHLPQGKGIVQLISGFTPRSRLSRPRHPGIYLTVNFLWIGSALSVSILSTTSYSPTGKAPVLLSREECRLVLSSSEVRMICLL